MNTISRRKFLKIGVVLFAVALPMLCTAASAQTPWQPGEYPISYWVGPLKEHNTLAVWQKVKDCNFTVFGMTYNYSVADNHKMLDICKQLGVKAIVCDGRTREAAFYADHVNGVKGLVAEYGAHPALYGYYLLDEPGANRFPDLAKASQELQRQDPKRLPYINLLPTYATPKMLGTPNYAEHLDRFLRLVKPAVLSYDHYALMADGSDRIDYYENLELIRKYGLRYDTPQWNVILSLPHCGYRDPSAAEMRWQVYTSLAYGMKGLMWFTYWTIPGWGRDKGYEDFGVAIADCKGEPARLYPIVKQLNGEVRTLGKTLLGLTSTDVYHTGAVPLGCTRLGIDAPFHLPGDRLDQNLLLGFFQDAKGQEYAMVVNRDHNKPVEAALLLKPHLQELTEISAVDGSDKPVAVDGRRVELSLGAGDGRLLRLTTAFDYGK